MKNFSVVVFSIISLILNGGSELKNNTYVFHDSVTILPKGTDGTAGSGAIYAYFGDWPQTVKSPEVMIDETKSITIGFNTYYLGSDNCYYAKLAEHGYSVQYSDGTPVGWSWPDKKSIKYFKVEPIKWRVLTENYKGTKRTLLFSESILDSDIPFDDNFTKSCDYETCSVRKYLNTKLYTNECFLKGAFTENAQQNILYTDIETEGNGIVSDKIFLLSLKEISNIENSNKDSDMYNLVKFPTDYALAKGIVKFESDGSPWWLRSIEYETGKAWCISFNGEKVCYKYHETCYGIVPALTIDLRNR